MIGYIGGFWGYFCADGFGAFSHFLDFTAAQRMSLKYLLSTGIPRPLVDKLIGWSRIMPRMDKTNIRTPNTPMKERSFIRSEKLWNERCRNWMFKPNIFSLVSRSYSTTRNNLLNVDNQQRSTDLTWINNEDKTNDLNNHLNSSLTSSLDIDLRSGDWRENYCYFNGIAQGSPLSPTLSTIILVHLIMLHPEIRSLFYADDGLLYSDKPFDPDKILGMIDKNSGVVAHPEGSKSGWIKRAGIWLKPLKFLNRIFIAHSIESENWGLMANSTRTPKEFTFTTKLAKIFGLAIEFDYWLASEGKILEAPNPYVRQGITEQWIYSKYYGMINSRIYLGSMKALDLDPNWNEYRWVIGSWSYYMFRQGQGISNLKTIYLPKPTNTNFQEISTINSDAKLTNHITLFNASSYASKYLANYIKWNKLNQTRFQNSCWNK